LTSVDAPAGLVSAADTHQTARGRRARRGPAGRRDSACGGRGRARLAG